MKKLRINIDGKLYDIEVEVLEDNDNQILPDYYQQHNTFTPPAVVPNPGSPAPTVPTAKKAKPKAKVEVDGNALTSPINGVVLEVLVKEGQAVKAGEVVAVLEAMKMKTNVESPKDGEIASVGVNMGDRVEIGDAIVTFK